MSSAEGLTVIQENVLQMIVVGQRLARAGRGVPPTYKEIMEWMGWRSPSTLQRTLDVLEARGFIRRPHDSSARAIEVLR
jgi:SOS-response transcriptional repressor LexA